MEESVSALQEAIELNPKSWLPHYALGLIYGKQLSYRRAQREFWIAFKLSPTKGRTGYAVLGLNIAIYTKEYSLIAAALGAIALIFRSTFAWPLILISSGYSFVLSYISVRSKKLGRAAMAFLFGIALIVFYTYYVYALPPFSR